MMDDKTFRDKTFRGLPYLSTHLEYIPVRTDPSRWVSLPDVQKSAPDAATGFGPLTTRILAAHDFFAGAAVFAAVCLVLMLIV